MPDQHQVPNSAPASGLDSFLRIEEVAQLLRVSKSWIYQRRETLPFVIRLPDGPLRVSVSKLREWLERSTQYTPTSTRKR